MLVHTPSPRWQPAANSQKVSASTCTRAMGIRHVGRGAGCRGSRRRGDARGGTGKHPREATWTPDAKTCSGVQEMPPRPKAWYYSLLALRSGGGGRQLCTAGTPQPETKHAAHETHIVWLSSACRRRGTQESRWATALPHNRPSVRTMPAARSPSYAAQPTTCYTRGCCWASNALPRLLAICHGCSRGGLLVSRKPGIRPPLCISGLPFPCGRDA